MGEVRHDELADAAYDLQYFEDEITRLRNLYNMCRCGQCHAAYDEFVRTQRSYRKW